MKIKAFKKEAVILFSAVAFSIGLSLGMLGGFAIANETAAPITEQTTQKRSTVEIVAEIENNTEADLISLGNFKATAYCPCVKCCGKSDGITATGTVATAGRTIAVDPSIIPYGTQLIIDGHTYTAEDCGGAIDGKTVDIFFNTHEEALQFGVQEVEIFCTSYFATERNAINAE